MSNVIKLHPSVTPDEALEHAKDKYSDVLILGFDKEGISLAYGSDGMTVRDIIYLMESFKNELLNGYEED